ncbi:efflux RND transporter permease subunit [Pantoea agglomerans]|uniref:efflux RND transporter permease subunit n=1 Tax=Enterobacter agglomerans TaxID=549 RepID=UPI0015C60A7F|nr:efflux RND transporter permease subunit [Pantoea agglomerans]NYB31487.1 efflux RND transporter permease subunit [Pantoea agglomerans]
MFSGFFVHRPIFAWVIALLIMMAGAIAIKLTAVAQYPEVSPPSVRIKATYTGASAQTIENSVTQVIEQQLTGLDNLLYFTSTSSSSGTAQITVSFKLGTNPDTAQVQVQDKLQQAESRLPTEVQEAGITVTKSQSDFLMIAALYDKTDRASSGDIADWLVSNIQDPLARISGVGSLNIFGNEYAMRIWLNPTKLAAYGLMPSDVESAITSQNVQLSAGSVGTAPTTSTQQIAATVQAESRLQTPEQFRNIIVKSEADGSAVRIRDVARVEMGSQDYISTSRLNGHPAAGLAVQLAAGANAMDTAKAVKDMIEKYRASMPSGYEIAYPKDTTEFIKLSIQDVVVTLLIAILLVIGVMYLFLQNVRATLIPALSVPVVLLGTFGLISLFGYTINTLTLFAMVLAIGLLVDDAIVVVENVERIMRNEKLNPREATEKSMGEISSALIAIAVVLSAVFLPMAFFGGSTGVIYRQFSITLISAMGLSVVVALTLTPALCGTLLRQSTPHNKGFFGRFNRTYSVTEKHYKRGVAKGFKHPAIMMCGYAVLAIVMGFLMVHLPTSFLPNEDQGQVMVQFTLPPGASVNRTNKVNTEVSNWFLKNEKQNTDAVFSVTGFNFSGNGDNVGMAFIALKDWNSRPGDANTAQSIVKRANKELSKVTDAQVVAMIPPAVSGMGQSNGFTFELMSEGSTSHADLLKMREQLINEANESDELQSVRAADLPETPQLKVDIDNTKAAALGLDMSDVTATLSSAWGGEYVDDFMDRGRVKEVYIEGDIPFRSQPSDLNKWFVRGTNSSGDSVMTPFSAFATTHWIYGPQTLTRYNGVTAFEIDGENTDGYSSGAAMSKMADLASKLPSGATFAWSGLSLQEQLASGQTGTLYAISIMVVFLCLAALYESWSVPFSVIMVIPLGIFGASTATYLRGLNNDIYFQVALLTTIGLASKNAILIIEFAEASVKRGMSLSAAALSAAKIRLRPILMTSFAFIAGIMPLAFSTGAGANSRIAIGTGIVGGTLSATILAIFFVPFFFVLVKHFFTRNRVDQE